MIRLIVGVVLLFLAASIDDGYSIFYMIGFGLAGAMLIASVLYTNRLDNV